MALTPARYNPDMAAANIAKPDSWKTLPLPTTRADLGFAASYTPPEFAQIQQGLIPQAMEDKWFIYYDNLWLYFHRSWTGAGIYGVRFQTTDSGASVVESWVSRDPAQYKESQLDYDRALLQFLIDAFLLGRNVAFPVPGQVSTGAPRGVYQHHVVGRAYPESHMVQNPRKSNPSILSIIKSLFRIN